MTLTRDVSASVILIPPSSVTTKPLADLITLPTFYAMIEEAVCAVYANVTLALTQLRYQLPFITSLCFIL